MRGGEGHTRCILSTSKISRSIARFIMVSCYYILPKPKKRSAKDTCSFLKKRRNFCSQKRRIFPPFLAAFLKSSSINIPLSSRALWAPFLAPFLGIVGWATPIITAGGARARAPKKLRCPLEKEKKGICLNRAPLFAPH